MGRGFPEPGLEAAYWDRDGKIIRIGDLPGGGHFSFATATSADGSVIVGSGHGEMQGAFVWDAVRGMRGLGDFPGGIEDSIAMDVSADGTTVVGFGFTGDSVHDNLAFVWDEAGGMRPLAEFDEHSIFGSQALGISADGSTLVGRDGNSLGREAVRWDAAGSTIQGLGDLPGGSYYSEAYATTPEGAVIVGHGRSESGREAFIWDEIRGMRGLGDLPGGLFDSTAFAVSADGSVVVGEGYGESGQGAFIWDETHGMRSLQDVLVNAGLDLGDWHLSTARGISADGTTIVGWGLRGGGTGGWVAAIPEPSTGLLVAFGLFVMVYPNVR